MQKKDIVRIYNTIQKCKKLKGGRFSYLLIKAQQLIENEVKALRESISVSKEYTEYIKKKDELKLKFCERDADNNPVIIEGYYRIPVFKQPDYETAKKELEKEHFEEIRKYNEMLSEYEKLLEEKIDIKFDKIAQADIPPDITGEQIDGIKEIIEWD